MGKDKKKRSGSAAPDPEALATLRLALAAGEAPELDDATFEALADALARADASDARARLEQLLPLASGSAPRLKALKRAAFRLGQRGVDLGDVVLEPRPRGIRIGEADLTGGLPILLAPIDTNSVRTLTFPLVRGPAAVVIEAVFKSRELFRLKATPGSREGYKRWASLKTQAAEGAVPERVRLPVPWLERKLWEIAGYYHRDQTGPEVDRGLVEAFPVPEEEPGHPARDLDLGATEPLPWSALGVNPERVRPLYQGAALAALRSQWYEAGGGPDIEASTDLRETMRRGVQDWIGQWGPDRIAELLLDAALFFHAIGDLDAARAYLWAAAPIESETRSQRIGDFLLDFAVWQLGQH